MELLDTIKYFAKFPLLSAVLSNFDGNDVPGYAQLKAYIQNMNPNSLIPDIESFIVGNDESAIASKIKDSIQGYFMYLEIPNISSSQMDQFRNRETQTLIAVIIAHPVDARSMDTMAQSIISDKCLQLTKQMIDIMKSDDVKQCGNKRLIDNAISINVVPPWLLYGCLGWELSIHKRNNLLI